MQKLHINIEFYCYCQTRSVGPPVSHVSFFHRQNVPTSASNRRNAQRSHLGHAARRGHNLSTFYNIAFTKLVFLQIRSSWTTAWTLWAWTLAKIARRMIWTRWPCPTQAASRYLLLELLFWLLQCWKWNIAFTIGDGFWVERGWIAGRKNGWMDGNATSRKPWQT